MPDGGSILYYTIDALDIADIYKIGITTQTVVDLLSDSTYYDYASDWSLDGLRFVFETNRPNKDDPIHNLFLAEGDSGNLVQLTDNNVNGWVDTLPAWSPDGKTIDFWQYNYIAGEEFEGVSDGLWLYDLASGEERLLYGVPITTEDVPPVWSPDGEYSAFLELIEDQHTMRIICVDYGKLFEINTISGDKRTLS